MMEVFTPKIDGKIMDNWFLFSSFWRFQSFKFFFDISVANDVAIDIAKCAFPGQNDVTL